MKIEELGKRCEDPSFWLELFPELHITEDEPLVAPQVLEVPEDEFVFQRKLLDREGYFKLESLLPESIWQPLAAVVRGLELQQIHHPVPHSLPSLVQVAP